MRPALDAEICASAGRFADHARACGWTVAVTYCRGTAITAEGEVAMLTVNAPVYREDGTPELTPTGRPRHRKIPTVPRVVDNVAVRCSREGAALVAFWHDRKLDSIIARIAGAPLIAPLIHEAAKELLSAHGLR